MARVTITEDKKSIGNRIADGISGAMKGVEWADQLAKSKAVREQLTAQAAQMRATADRQQQALKMQSTEGLINGLSQAGTMTDPKLQSAYLKAHAPIFQNFADNAGIEFDSNDLEQLKPFTAVFSSFKNKFQNSMAILENNPEQADVRKMSSDLMSQLSSMPPAFATALTPYVQQFNQEAQRVTAEHQGLRPTQMGADGQTTYEDTSLDEARIKTQQTQAQANLTRSEAQYAKNTQPPTEKPNEFLKKADTEAIGKIIKSSERADKDVLFVDRLLSNMGDVDETMPTGVFSGSDWVSNFRRFIQPSRKPKKGAKRYDLYNALLSQEALEAIKSMAETAGVRSIDTPAEQKRVIDTVAGRTNTPYTNYVLLMLKKDLALRDQQKATDVRSYVESNPNKGLTGFESNMNKTASYFDPMTGDIKLVRPGEEKPEGYKSLEELYSNYADQEEKRQGIKRPGKAVNQPAPSTVNIDGLELKLQNE